MRPRIISNNTSTILLKATKMLLVFAAVVLLASLVVLAAIALVRAVFWLGGQPFYFQGG